MLSLPSWLPTVHVVDVIGVLSLLFAAAGWLPQLVRIRASGDASGVSVSALANGVVSLTAWTAYGVWLSDTWVTLQSAAGLVPAVATCALAWRARGNRQAMGLPALWVVLLAATAALSAVVGPGPITVVLGGSVLWTVVPAAVAAWRSDDVSGIAPGTWLLTVGNALVTGTYGLLAHVPANLVYTAIALAGATIILSRVLLAGSARVAPALP